MTAEILLMNRSAVAMAADSLVSVTYRRAGDHAITMKSYDRVRKLLPLHGKDPVGVMFYDSPDFLGLPWEVILGEFARERTDSFDRVIDYALAFFAFLDELCDRWVTDDARRDLIQTNLSPFIDKLETAWNERNSNLPNQPQAYQDAARETVRTAVERRRGQLEMLPKVNLTTAQLGRSNGVIRSVFAESVRGLWKNLDESHRVRLVRLGRDELGRIKNSEPDRTGLVFAGFGRLQLFPASHVYVVAGHVEGGVRCCERSTKELTPDNPGLIMPVAQTSMVQAFMEGINPHIRDRVDALLDELVKAVPGDQAAQAGLRTALKKRLDDDVAEHLEPVVKGVGFLSAHDVAELARSLVAFTALRNRVSLQADTVGGPFDVAVMSRAEGFVWVERAFELRRGRGSGA